MARDRRPRWSQLREVGAYCTGTYMDGDAMGAILIGTSFERQECDDRDGPAGGDGRECHFDHPITERASAGATQTVEICYRISFRRPLRGEVAPTPHPRPPLP